MKLIFLCGALEPGCDGVGDYVRQLACELILNGNEVSAVSINDHYIQDVIEETQCLDGIRLPVFRIPACRTTKSSFEEASKWIHKYDPDWISLQFVPYSFHHRGFHFLLPTYLKKLTGNKKVHVMIHEAWSGTGDRFQPKSILTSYLQKFLINNILLTVRPIVIHTHLPEYKERLEKLNHTVKVLPLFSNIKVWAEVCGKPMQKLVIGFFSQVECKTTIISFLSEISRQALKSQVDVEVLLIGGSQLKMKQFRKFLQSHECFLNNIRITGFLSPKDLSNAIQSCSLGITSVPRHALGKSGSVAAFLAHGVPVAAPNVNANKREDNIGLFSMALRSTIITEPDIIKIGKSKTGLGYARKEISVAKVAQTFIADLKMENLIGSNCAIF